jgi:hypothetical protein
VLAWIAGASNLDAYGLSDIKEPTRSGGVMSDSVTITKTEDYAVKPKTPITLTVEIGEGQVGGTAVTWNNTIVGSGGDVTDLPIGKKNDDLRGTSLDCTTTVKDINPNTNNTTVTYTLKGGKQQRSFTYSADVNVPEARAIYSVTFLLD